MGGADSKLKFKNHIFKLYETPDIPEDDDYWEKFWQQPESASDVFTLLAASDIRKTLTLELSNMKRLIEAICGRLSVLHGQLGSSNQLASPGENKKDIKELLNCIRLLTRILPYLFEAQVQDNRMKQWLDDLFWSEHDPLGPKLIDIGTDLLHKPGFTVIVGEKASNIIWDTGVGCATPMVTSHDTLQHRVEVLRFLLALASECLYMTPTNLAVQGSKFVGYMVARPDGHKQSIMTVLCSLLNTCMKYSPGWKVPYEHVLISDRSRQLVCYSLQYLMVLLTYSPPSNDHKNWYRHYLSKIHRASDLQFLAGSITRLLSQPISASASYLPGSERQIPWITELCMLFWDLIQCNRKFSEFLLQSGYVQDFVVLFLYYVNEKASEGIVGASTVRLCVYILLYLSSDPEVGKSLVQRRFEGQGFLPSSIKLSAFNGSYADYLIIQLMRTVKNLHSTDICRRESNSPQPNRTNLPVAEIRHLTTNILNCIYNISPFVSGISYSAGSALVHLFMMLSSSQNASSINAQYLDVLLKSIKMLVEFNFRKNRRLVFVMLKNERSFRSIRQMATKGKEQDLENKQAQVLQDLIPVLDWLVLLIDDLEQNLPYAEYFASDYSSASNNGRSSKLQPHIIIDSIASLQKLANIDVNADSTQSLEQFEPFRFSWTSDSLGWYESILWGGIYQNESQVGNSSNSLGDTAIGIYSTTVGVWSGTDIRLFKIQETSPIGPSIVRPQGAVDAVADSFIQRFSKLTSRSQEHVAAASSSSSSSS